MPSRHFFQILLAVSMVLSISSFTASAQQREIKYVPNVDLPGFATAEQPITIDKDSIGKYIAAFYNYAWPMAGVVAIVVLLAAGLIRVMSAGSQERVTLSEELMWAGITGLVLVLTAWVLLNTINPQLVRFGQIKLPDIESRGAGQGVRIGLTRAPRERTDPVLAAMDESTIFQQGNGICKIKNKTSNTVLYCFRNISPQECGRVAIEITTRDGNLVYEYVGDATACGPDPANQPPDGGVCIAGINDWNGTCITQGPQNFCPSRFVSGKRCTDYGACYSKTSTRYNVSDTCKFVDGINCASSGDIIFRRGMNCIQIIPNLPWI